MLSSLRKASCFTPGGLEEQKEKVVCCKFVVGGGGSTAVVELIEEGFELHTRRLKKAKEGARCA